MSKPNYQQLSSGLMDPNSEFFTHWALRRTLMTWAERRARPRSPQINPCRDCRYFFGRTYLVCAIHPGGPQVQPCPDYSP